MAQKARVVRARSWDELPEVLEPGTYYINGEGIEAWEPVSKASLRRTLAIMKQRRGRYI